MPRGGSRRGAGRKPKVAGYSHLGPNVVSHPSIPSGVVPTTNDLSPIEEFDAPNDLSMDERNVWLQQAPHAFKNRTLTRATALSFERYCRLVVQERNESKSSASGGANHRGLLKQVNSYEIQFMLTAVGKPMLKPVASAQDDDEAFFGTSRVLNIRPA